MTADLERGAGFLPVTAVGPDFYGGDRAGETSSRILSPR